MTKPIPPQHSGGAPLRAPQSHDSETGLCRPAARADRLAALCLGLALCGPGLLHGSRAAVLVPAHAKSPQMTPHKALPVAQDGQARSATKLPPLPTLPAPRESALLVALTRLAAAPEPSGALRPAPPIPWMNTGARNPRPVRAMFPLFAAGQDTPSEKPANALPALPDLAIGATPRTTRLSHIDPALNSSPVPRADSALNALPAVWRAGHAMAPFVRFADANDAVKNEAPPAPAATTPSAPGLPGMGPSSLVLNVAALTLPPPARPLPPALQSKAVPADTRYISSLPRLAQAGTVGDTKPPAPGPTNQIDVTVSTFVVLVTPDDLQTVAIADPTIADVAVVNARTVLVNGKAPGATSLVIVDKKIRQYNVRVVPTSGESVENMTSAVASAINLPNVQVRGVKDAIVLDGTVANADEKRMAAQIAAIFATKVVDRLQIRTAEPVGIVEPLPVQIKNAIRNDAVRVQLLGDTILLEGTVTSAADKERAAAVAAALAKDMKVVDLIHVPEPPAPAAPPRLTVDDVNDILKPMQAAPAPNAPGQFPAMPAPVSRITARAVKDQIILEGVAANQAALDQAATVAARSGLTVVNRVEIAAAAPALPAELQLLNTIGLTINRAVPGANVMVSGGATRLVLTGSVPNTNAAVLAEQIARGYSKQVDSLMTTPRPQQIDVDITVLEIIKNRLNNLGVTFPSLLDSNTTGFVVGQTAAPAAGGSPFQAVTPFQIALHAEINNGNARLLSNPHTTVLSGRTATFKVGGEVPIPTGNTTNQAGTTTTLSFKPFGVLLDVTPVASDDGAVTMQVRSEVSQPDPSLGITLNGALIPGFSQRQAQTEVTVEPGGTLALGGLIQNNSRELVRKLPVLGNIPVLGALFTSKRYQKDETELVFFITPRVLDSKLKPGQQAMARPVTVGQSYSLPVPMGINGIPSFTTEGIFGIGPNAGGGGGGAGGAGGQ